MKSKILRIAQVAPLWFTIPPKKYGGSERIVSFLTEGLVGRGHQVTLFAPADSKTKAKLVPFIKKGAIAMGAKWQEYWWPLINHALAFEKAGDFDIIHCHWGIMGAYFQRLVNAKVVHTMHNIPARKHLRWKVFNHYKNDLNIVFISESERKNAPLKFKNSRVIYNGIDLKPFKFNPSPGGYLLWVGRICPAKGPQNAIKIAKKTGSELLMAGQLQPQHYEYFQQEIKPNLSQKIKYLGELGQRDLVRVYGEAKTCLYPIEWEEPFGLVMAEAMACGTPVIAFDRGSVKEVVRNGKTGFVVQNVSQAINALKKIGQIKRQDCRAWVEENFTSDKMVEKYEKFYYETLKL